MSKSEFLENLRKGLRGLPQSDVDERCAFYSEMIDDRIEEGMSEEEAVAAAGTVESIVTQILDETPISKIVKENIAAREKPGAGAIVLIILGFPVWFPLLCAAAAVLLSLYFTLWTLVVSLLAVELSLLVSALGCVGLAVYYAFSGYPATAALAAGALLVLAGLSIFLFFGCRAAVKGMIRLTALVIRKIKRLFIGKEGK